MAILLADWGTSSLRLWLAELSRDEYRILDQKQGPGTKFCGDKETAFFDGAGDMIGSADDILICGTAGSNIGWMETGYAMCPAGLPDIASGVLTFKARGKPISIIPGVMSRQNIAGYPDTMRGEETQVLGWMGQRSLRSHLICLPGTHSKWVQIDGVKITNVSSALTGELFDVLLQNTILIPNGAKDAGFDSIAFLNGVDAAAKYNFHMLLPLVRAQQLSGDMTPEESKSWMSGLIIGGEIQALNPQGKPFTIIGSQSLCEVYAIAAKALDIDVIPADDEKCTLDGLVRIYRSLQ